MSLPPERIGKYRVLERIGRGGMGAVYKAHDPSLDRLVAVKLMNEEAASGPEGRARFLREAQSAARLNHPNIITVYELGEERGLVFIVMELLEGEPLSRLVARVPPLPLRQKLDIMEQICEGLAFAHRRGVVHRDIKPANIFVLEGGRVKILDFGIARTAASDLTRTGLLLGTPNYMSPEQARGRKTDARSDIFSVGVVFYELLSGHRPFVADDYFEVLEKVRSEEPEPLRRLAPDLHPALVAVVERAMAKDPEARCQRLEDVRVDLGTVAEGLELDYRDLARLELMRERPVQTFGEPRAGEPGAQPAAVRPRAAGIAVATPTPAGSPAEPLSPPRSPVPRAVGPEREARQPRYWTSAILGVGAGLAVLAGGALLFWPGEPTRTPSAPPPAATPAPRAPETAGPAGPPPTAGPGPTVPAASNVPPGPGAAGVAPGPTAAPAPGPTSPVGRVTPGPARLAPGAPRAPGAASAAARPGVPPAAGGPRPALPSVGGPAPPVGGSPSPAGRARGPAAPAIPPAGTPALSPAPAPAGRTTSPPGMTPGPAARVPAAPETPAPTARGGEGPRGLRAVPPAAGPPAPAPAEPAAAAPQLSPEQRKALADELEIARLFQGRGDLVRAREAYRRILEVDPTHAEARAGLAEVERSPGR